MVLMYSVVGPTASGKSKVAIELAQRLGRAEIINFDAFQIYKGLEIISAAPTVEEQKQIPHWLFGFLSPTEEWDAVQHTQKVLSLLDDFRKRNITPILVGGSGFYLKNILCPLPDLPPANPELRQKLEQLPSPQLLEKLQQLDPVCFQKIDQANLRRVIRAVEVCLLTSRPFSSFEVSETPRFPVRGVFLHPEREQLRETISRRTEQMLVSGAVEEIAALPAHLSRSAAQCIGIQEIQNHLQNGVSLQETAERISLRTSQYAKRQITFFKRYFPYPQATSSQDALKKFLEAPTS